jgi:tRNA(adenine34) deaminase
MNDSQSDLQHEWMRMALAQATLGLDAGEAPIGAVLIDRTGRVIGDGYNTLLSTGNPTLHAEINAFAAAAGRIDPDGGLTLVSTLEPCVMCTGAAMQSGVTTIVYGLQAPADAGTGRVKPPTSPGATSPEVLGGVKSGESRALFVRWLAMHEGDASRETQREFVQQLLALTSNTPLT